LARRIERQKNNAKDAVELDRDDPMLRNRIDQAGNERRAPDQDGTDNDRDQQPELNGGQPVREPPICPGGGEEQRYEKPADERCRRDLYSRFVLALGPGGALESSIQSKKNSGDDADIGGQNDVGQIAWNSHGMPLFDESRHPREDVLLYMRICSYTRRW